MSMEKFRGIFILSERPAAGEWVRASDAEREIERLRAELMERRERAGLCLTPGDYFTHSRSGATFVCRAVIRHDRDGMSSPVRAEVEFCKVDDQ